MTIICDSTVTDPTHHVKLTDGITSLGFILRSGNTIDPRAITRRPRQQGQYSPFTQSEWSGGRGIKDAQSDRSRFADSKRMITRHAGSVLLAGQEKYTTGYRQAEAYLPGNMSWVSLLTTNRYIAYKFTASATGNREKIYLWVRRRGTPTSTLTVELCANTVGSPGSVLKTATATTTNITDTVSVLYEFVLPSVQAVTATTLYHIKVYTSTADDTTNYWQVGTDVLGEPNLTQSSSDGSNWSNASYDLYFRIVDDTDQLGGLFFNFKGALYFVTRPSGAAAPKLFINGDRGIATGTHSTTTLQDTTKTWTVNEWAGAVLYIFDGTNSEWQTPYRTIASNTADTLTFSPAFPKAPVSADTVYIIMGSNKWTEISSHGLTVLPTSIATDGATCYFAQGDTTSMIKMREYRNNVTWTREFAGENNYATFLGTYRHPTKGLMIYKVNNYGNNGQPVFAQAQPESEYWNRLRWPQLIDACEATTGWTFGANVTGSADNIFYQAGAKSIKCIKAAGSSTTAPFAYRAFTQYSIDAYKHTAIRFWIYSTVAFADSELKIRFSAANDCSTSLITDLDVPGFAANQWVQVSVAYPDTTTSLKYMTSFGFIATINATVYIDGIELVPAGSETLLGNRGERITGVITYGDPEVPWVFRTQSAGSVENGVFNPIPLKEMSQAENIHNGMGSVVHNVYLYFSFLHGLERFYRNNMDDVGPNRDEGFPDTRRGFITSMQGYIGRFFYNYDCLEGYSSILESTSGSDHHEIYRCDTAGKRIRNLFIQVVPGDIADRLWFTEGDDIAWMPLPGNTLKEDTDDTFRFSHEGYLETGWIYGNEQDAVKAFHNVKLFTEKTTSNRKIEWDYMTDDNTTWTPVSTAFTTPPVQEITLSVSAKRIKLRFRMQSNANTVTPLIRGMVISGTTRPETRYTYTFNTRLDDAGIDLQGDEDTTQSAATTLSTLDGWMEANTPLTMSSVFSPFDNKTVMLEPIVAQPSSIVFDESEEKIATTLILTEP